MGRKLRLRKKLCPARNARATTFLRAGARHGFGKNYEGEKDVLSLDSSVPRMYTQAMAAARGDKTDKSQTKTRTPRGVGKAKRASSLDDSQNTGHQGLKAKKPKTKKESQSKPIGYGRPGDKGYCGNPGGRPAIPQEVKDSCRAASMEAVNVLLELMRGKNGKHPVPAIVRARAAEAILDRAWGKVAAAPSDDGGSSQAYLQALEEAHRLRKEQGA